MSVKTRILEGGFFGNNYTSDFISRELNNFHFGALVKDWDLTDVIYYPEQSNFIIPKFDGVNWIESETIENINAIKYPKYKKRAKSYYSLMYTRALASSMNKSGLDLNELIGIREEYEKKYKVSTGVLTSGTVYDNVLQMIQDEMDDEFSESVLDALLPTFGVTPVGTHLNKMFQLIIFKFEYGESDFSKFFRFITRFRTKSDTWIKLGDWNKLDSGFAIADTLPESLTVQDAQTLSNQFNSL